jgi:hypothetical protein
MNVLRNPGLAKAHDWLSSLLEDPDAGNDQIRDAAIDLCAALNADWSRRSQAVSHYDDLIKSAGLLIECEEPIAHLGDGFDKLQAAVALANTALRALAYPADEGEHHAAPAEEGAGLPNAW